MIDSALAGTSLSTIPHGTFVADEVNTYKPSTVIYTSLARYINSTPTLNDSAEVPSENIWLVSG